MRDLAGTMLGISLQRLLHTQTTLYSQKRWRNGPKTMRKLLPRHFEIIEEIDKRFKEMIHATGKDMVEKLSGMQILDNSNPQKPVVHMANLCVVSSHTWMFWVLSRRWVHSVAKHSFSEKIKEEAMGDAWNCR